MPEHFNSDGTSESGRWIWEQNKAKSCEKCGEETDELYCTPIGSCNWRCRDCQIALRQAIPLTKEMLDTGGSPFEYPVAPVGYVDPPLEERAPYMFKNNIFGKKVLKREYKCYEEKEKVDDIN